MALIAMRRDVAGWIGVLAAVALLTGCTCHPHSHRVEHDAPPPPAPAPPAFPAAAPPATAPPASYGSAPGGTWDEGVRDGEEAAEDEAVAHYAVLGAVTAPLILVCIAAAAGGGGGGGNCGGGGGNIGGSGSARYLPSDAGGRSEAYVNGYHEGYAKRIENRRENAFLGGFLVGIALTAVGVGIYLYDRERRENLENEAGQHATAGGRRRGATVFEF